MNSLGWKAYIPGMGVAGYSLLQMYNTNQELNKCVEEAKKERLTVMLPPNISPELQQKYIEEGQRLYEAKFASSTLACQTAAEGSLYHCKALGATSALLLVGALACKVLRCKKPGTRARVVEQERKRPRRDPTKTREPCVPYAVDKSSDGSITSISELAKKQEPEMNSISEDDVEKQKALERDQKQKSLEAEWKKRKDRVIEHEKHYKCW